MNDDGGNVYFSDSGKAQGNIYLASEGTLQELFAVDEKFLGDIPQHGRLLYVLYALKNNPKKYTECVNDFSHMFYAHNRTDVGVYLANDFSTVKQLTSFHAVVIEQGDIDLLINEMDRTGFGNILDNFSRHGGIIYGRSTGGIILGKYIDTCRDVNQEFKSGCDLIGRYSYCPNYRDEDKNGWAAKHDSPLICTKLGVGVQIKDGHIEWSNERGYTIYQQ